MASRLVDHFKAGEKVQPKEEDEDEDVASDEAPSSGHVINMYQYLNATQKKKTIKKEPPKHNRHRYNFRSQRDPTLFEILKEKF